MRGFILPLAAALTVTAIPAEAATIIATGTYDSGESVFETGGVILGPGRYRFNLDFSTAPLFQDSEVSKQTTTSFFCMDPDVQPGEFYCGGDTVPTLTPFVAQTPTRYFANMTVNPPSNWSSPLAPGVRYEQFDDCCGYEVDFEGLAAGSWTLSFSAVPEPQQWMLMILGIGIAGASMRMRRASIQRRLPT